MAYCGPSFKDFNASARYKLLDLFFEPFLAHLSCSKLLVYVSSLQTIRHTVYITV